MLPSVGRSVAHLTNAGLIDCSDEPVMPAAAFAYRPTSRSYPNDRPRYFLQPPLSLCLLPRSGPFRSIAQIESDSELCACPDLPTLRSILTNSHPCRYDPRIGWKDRFRRISVGAGYSGDGPFNEPIAVAQPWPRERVLLPHSRPSRQRKQATASGGKRA
jgi:hypothetical protein